MDIKVPDIGIDKVEVIEILVKKNDSIVKEQSLIVVEGEKASMEIPSPFSGIIKDIKVNVTDFVKTGSVIVVLDIENHQEKLSTIKLNSSSNEIIKNQEDIPYISVYASPIIRRLARSLNINLNKVIGTGRKNRIIKKDLDNYLSQINHPIYSTNSIQNDIKKNVEQYNFKDFGEVKEVQLKKIKQISGNAVFKNWTTIPHVTQFDEVDITDLEIFRKQYNTEQKNITNDKLTILSFIIKVVATALKKFPYFNSSISLDNKTIFLKKYINIGFVVHTNNGLLVPVIKNVNNKSLLEISHEILQKSQASREGKLNILDLKGGSFTISSLGNIGGTFFSPIIYSSEAAILGVSKAIYKPIWNGQEFIPRLILPLSLSYNHRIIDGVDGVQFISLINKLLSNINFLLI